jgi:hypothetical protein
VGGAAGGVVAGAGGGGAALVVVSAGAGAGAGALLGAGAGSLLVVALGSVTAATVAVACDVSVGVAAVPVGAAEELVAAGVSDTVDVESRTDTCRWAGALDEEASDAPMPAPSATVRTPPTTSDSARGGTVSFTRTPRCR